jgi:transcription elongation factor
MNVEHMLGNPNDKGHEGTEKTATCPTSKEVTSIDMVPTIDGDNVTKLPKRMDWDQTIGSRNIRFPND